MKRLIMFLAAILMAAPVYAYDAVTWDTVPMMALGESTSQGIYYTTPCDTVLNVANYYPEAQIPVSWKVPNIIASSLATSTGHPVTMHNKAVSGRRIGEDLVTGQPGTLAKLADDQARVVIIYSGINNCIQPNMTYQQIIAQYDTQMRELVSNCKRTGKMPIMVNGADMCTYSLLGGDLTPYMSKYAGTMAEHNAIASDKKVWVEASTRLPTIACTYMPNYAMSSDGMHYTPSGYSMIAGRVATFLSPKMTLLRNANVVSRWYGVELNTAPSASWISYWSGRITAVGVDAAAEECYTMLGCTEQAWIQNVLTNMGLGTSLYTTYYNWMNSQTTNKHGKVLNYIINSYLANTATSGTPYQARCQMINKGAVAFAWGFVYNKAADGPSLASVTYNNSTVYAATANWTD